MKSKICVPPSLHFSFEMDSEDGEFLAAYVKVRDHKIHRTLRVGNGEARVDLGWRGEVVGVELLGSCRGHILEQIAVKHHEPTLRKAALNPRLARFLSPAIA
jgi:hypothetical protein